MTRPLEGRAALITGANQGLGLAIARAYVAAGASVMLCARDAAAAGTGPRGARTRRSLRASRCWSRDGGRVASRTRWSALVEATLATFPQPPRAREQRRRLRPDGADRGRRLGRPGCGRSRSTCFGSVLMCRALLPHFQAAAATARSSSSRAAAPPTRCPRISAYAASKAAIVRFAETLAEEVRGRRHRRQRHRARRAEHAAARRGARRPAPGRSARRSTTGR